LANIKKSSSLVSYSYCCMHSDLNVRNLIIRCLFFTFDAFSFFMLFCSSYCFLTYMIYLWDKSSQYQFHCLDDYNGYNSRRPLQNYF